MKSEKSAYPILIAKNLGKKFRIHQSNNLLFGNTKYVHAFEDVNLEIYKGETLGLVGESGCGKSTLAKTLIRLYTPNEGSIEFEGHGDISHLHGRYLQLVRYDMQMVFQDPYSSLNPRMSIRQIFYEIFKVHKIYKKSEFEEKTKEILEMVGIPEYAIDRYPGEFSGGQRQRIGIARALAMNPSLLIADEPVSALDVSIQAQIINLLTELKEKLNLTMLFISHDLSVVEYISDRVAIMYLGKIVELAPTEQVYNNPAHPYSDILIKAGALMQDELNDYCIEGETPSPINIPSGCRFHPRCPYACELCKEKEPELRKITDKHQVACHFPFDFQKHS